MVSHDVTVEQCDETSIASDMIQSDDPSLNDEDGYNTKPQLNDATTSNHYDVTADINDVTKHQNDVIRDKSDCDPSSDPRTPQKDDRLVYDPPDGGYGWVICACAFVHQLIADGHLFCFGVLYMALLDHYGASRSETATVGAVLVGTSCMSGPIAGAVVNRFSLRTAGILGSLITTSGLLASCFAPNILVLTLTYGLVTGLGLGFLFLTSIVSCNVYFKKKRALANGLALLGSGVGIFLTPPMMTFILDYYGLFGTWLILAGLSLNGCVVGALYRPLPLRHDIKSSSLDSNNSVLDNGTTERSHQTENHQLLSLPNRLGTESITNSNRSLRNECGSTKIIDSTTSIHSLWDPKVTKLSHIDLCYIGSNHTISTIALPPEYSTKRNRDSRRLCSLAKKSPKIFQKLFSSLSCHLLASPVEILLILSAVLWTGQSTTHTFFVDYADSVGITGSQGALLISVIGITNCLGRIPVALLTNNPKIRSVYVYQVGLVLGGVSNIAIPYVRSYPVLMFLATVFGLSMSCLCSLRPIIVVDNMGIENLAGALGLLILGQGMAYMIVPPISGAILEATNSFELPFVLNGLCFLLGIFVLLPTTLRCIRNENVESQV